MLDSTFLSSFHFFLLMKKAFNILSLFFLALLMLSSCKKDEPNFRATSKTQIIFDDNINKVTADYKRDSNLVLKITANGASSIRVTSQYFTSTGAKTKDLGTLSVADGSATLNIPAISVRNTADGAVGGATGASSRPDNTYTLKVDAILPDGSNETRYFSAVIVQ